MPQEEKTPKNKTKVEDTLRTLNCYVNNGQGQPVHVLERDGLEKKTRAFFQLRMQSNTAIEPK